MEYEKLIEKAKLNKANIVVYVNAEYTGAGNHGNIIEFSPKEFTKKKYSIVSKLKDEYLNQLDKVWALLALKGFDVIC